MISKFEILFICINDTALNNVQLLIINEYFILYKLQSFSYIQIIIILSMHAGMQLVYMARLGEGLC